MEYDICSIGSALVDLTFKIDDEFVKQIEQKGIVKGGMTLIEKDDQNELVEELIQSGKIPDKACGGSATNSVVAASLFGSSCFMSCIVGDDENGKFYLEDLSQNGINHNSNLINSEMPSGQCLVMVSDDAERTMCTNLGINSEFSAQNVDEEIIKNSNYLFLEGYLLASPEGFDSFKKAFNLAKKYNVKVALSLSDIFIVNTFKEELKELISISCDLIFCNEGEASEFANSNSEEEIFKFFKNYSPKLLVTQGPKGCIGYDEEGPINIPGIEANAIDTNGAGDMFAGAVISSLNQSKNLKQSAEFGCFAASKIVQNSGPRLIQEEYVKIKENFSSY
ncbi:MAG: adenosine kinase [Gammaproteobacteria bacterium]|nr:MAG: adenosine kinase [Gammaproteobacteria bacterium]